MPGCHCEQWNCCYSVIPVVTVNAEMGICSHIEALSQKKKKKKERKKENKNQLWPWESSWNIQAKEI